MTLKIKIALLLLTGCAAAYGQFAYKRDITGISEQWHRLELPDALFGKVAADLADLRIYGVTPKGDTLEAPYLLRRSTEQILEQAVDFQLINTTRNNRGWFFTFEIPAETAINQLKLVFDQTNFDWRVQLEGSPDQREWFTILADYRILSIRNGLTDFQFTKLAFPDVKYRFFRLRIPASEKPALLSANLAQYTVSNGAYKSYPAGQLTLENDKKNKETALETGLRLPVPVSRIRVHVHDTFDYYRPVSIQYISDSVKTEKGWTYNYTTLASGTLNSLEENSFPFNSTILQKLKIVVSNADNQPLQIDSVTVSGYIHELVARFTEPGATYFLAYGNPDAPMPQYDIGRFAETIPEQLTPLDLGDEQPLAAGTPKATAPLFENKVWLWLLMGGIILLLGWFTLRMMQKQQ